VLDKAAQYVAPGGRLVYVTCSLLAAENEDRVTNFLGKCSDFEPIAVDALTAAMPELARFGSGLGLRLTPHSSGTDGFFVAGLRRRHA
jgi:16S rRNA (cytosine967-C5)-methyltransferase